MRRFLLLRGDAGLTFLQGLLTQDLATLETARIQFAALLSPQGKILHTLFLVNLPDAILIDTAAAEAEALQQRLMRYKLRARITLEPLETPSELLATLPPLPDPRHPTLPLRDYAHPETLEDSSATFALGIPELGRDYAPDTLTALDAGLDLLHAVSFTKGCYVGQEITARMHYKEIDRKGFYRLEAAGHPPRLACLRHEEVTAAGGHLTLDGILYHATQPAAMARAVP